MDNEQALKIGCGFIAFAFIVSIFISIVKSAASTPGGLVIFLALVMIVIIAIVLWFKHILTKNTAALQREESLRKQEGKNTQLNPEETKEVILRSEADWGKREAESKKIRLSRVIDRELRLRAMEGNKDPMNKQEEAMLLKRSTEDWQAREEEAATAAQRLEEARNIERSRKAEEKRMNVERRKLETEENKKREQIEARERAKIERARKIEEEKKRLVEEKEAKVREEAHRTLDKSDFFEANGDLISRFLEVAYRRVTAVDEYGDEDWDALEKEIPRCIAKIDAKNPSQAKSFRFWMSRYSREEWLKERFIEYHSSRAEAKPNSSASEVAGMTGVEFESYVGSLLKLAQFEEVSGTPRTGDQGADIIAVKDGRRIVIQAKRYNGTVGNKAVQEVIAAMSFYQANEGWVVTNATFTKSARELANKSHIRLIDGNDLSNPDHHF